MNKVRLLVLALTVMGVWGRCQASTPEDAARGVLNRLLPGKADQFVLQSIPQESGQDVFEIDSANGKVVLRGSGAVSICTALHWYLKYQCNVNVSWCGSQLALPDPLPAVARKIRRVSPYKYRYYFNYCTFSYTMAFWDWDRWEREIDWMALNGINMPLAITGQEAVWRSTYRKMGLSEEDLGKFFAGPAYFAWGWMGNLDGWGGPLPQSWIDGHAELQKKILARQRELGITPVLPAFSGHVPAAIVKKFPQAKIRTLTWGAFSTFMLDVTDPLFPQIGKAFLEEQTRMFGTDHLYSADTFNEMTPPSNDPNYLAASAKAVYESMASADPNAVWVMQGWLFMDRGYWREPQMKGLLSAVPNDRMVILDLNADAAPIWKTSQAFYGKPYIWCALHVFGANRTLQGNLGPISRDLPSALKDPARGNLVGMGLTMEGIETNPVYYDLATEMAWRSDTPDLEKWISQYARRRYGQSMAEADKAWQTLRQTAYSGGQVLIGATVCAIPSLAGSGGWVQPKLHYPAARLMDVWRLLAACSDRAGKVDAYQYDLVDVSRQVLANMSTALHSQVVGAYIAKDRLRLKAASQRFLDLAADMDELLATRKEFLLGRWTEDARHWATNDQEKALYEFNARNQITFWGGRNSDLHGYAHKQWAGLIKGFYLPRWEMFFKALDDSLAVGKPADFPAIQNQMADWGQQWVHKVEPYPSKPAGDPVEVSLRLLKKYETIYRSAYGIEDNLTTEKPVKTSSGDGRAAVDGTLDINGYWDAGNSPAWLQIDLKEVHTLDRVQVFPYWDGSRYYQYTVEVSDDGQKWTTVGDMSKNTRPASIDGDLHRFAPTRARLIKVTMIRNSANPSVHLVEVRAYEAK